MIPHPITAMTMEQELHYIQLCKDLESNSDITKLRQACKDLIKQNFIYRNNVSNLTKHIIKSDTPRSKTFNIEED